ncbi:MAG TPA: PHP domain-containing protein [Methylomirabilota bacterium]
MDNAGIADALREMAALLALEGASPFKIRAYERGARAIDALALDDMARRGWLTRDEVLNTRDADGFLRAVRP